MNKIKQYLKQQNIKDYEEKIFKKILNKEGQTTCGKYVQEDNEEKLIDYLLKQKESKHKERWVITK